MQLNKPGIYIHIPFCRHKCNYCDFYLITNLNIIDRFLDNLKKEIVISSKFYDGSEFDSIFIGGGTPSILSGKQICNILDVIYNNFRISEKSEVTIEANPEDFINNYQRLSEVEEAGINRISFGVQSFNDTELKFLSREHNSHQAVEVIEEAKKHFENISIDLIYSLPEQKVESLINSIETAVNLGIPHISAYTLIYEKETPIYNSMKRNIISKNEDKYESELYSIFSDKLLQSGYCHYEVSNFALSGFKSRHNLKYWEYANYIGFGPSAHSFWNGKRWNNFRNIIKYNINLQKDLIPSENEYRLSSDEMKTEFIMLGLRSKGINLENYKKIFGSSFKDEFSSQINEIRERGHGEIGTEYFSLSEKGYLLADEICARYF
ncbi:MAG: radical SAM family heme chaperone HemW [Ignavibacteriae bacterium]|nr:radical SAM family heme chaperone HemW [Ignavibacteriota bacterium]